MCILKQDTKYSYRWYHNGSPSNLIDALKENPNNIKRHLMALEYATKDTWDLACKIMHNDYIESDIDQAKVLVSNLELLRNEFLEAGMAFKNDEGWWISEVIKSTKDLIRHKSKIKIQ